jgi:hypothetical protein
LDADFPVVAENPRMLGYAQAIVGRPFCKTQPYYHGDAATKETWFWRNDDSFRPLLDTNRLVLPAAGTEERKKYESIWREPPGENRKANRSKSFPGMANAIASQWF